MPVDTYKKDVDELVPNELHYDWEALREEVLLHGVRNSTLSAQMPSESSSVVSNATNGIEPPRGYLSVKKSKKGPLKQIVPQYQTEVCQLFLKLKYVWQIFLFANQPHLFSRENNQDPFLQ